MIAEFMLGMPEPRRLRQERWHDLRFDLQSGNSVSKAKEPTKLGEEISNKC